MKELAGTVVEALKASPAVLFLVLFNVAILTLVYFNAHDLRDHFETVTDRLLLQQQKMAELLVNCGGQK